MALNSVEAPTFDAAPRKLFIDGARRDAVSGRVMEVLNPATGERLTTVPEGDAADIDLAVLAARRSYEAGSWRDLPAPERGKILWRLADLVEAHIDEIARLDVLDSGIPYSFARYGTVASGVQAIRYYAGLCDKFGGKTMDLQMGGQPVHAYTLREPIGVVGLIIPWNFPFPNAAMKIAPALAAGCSCVLKPSEVTPLSAIRLIELVMEAGVPPGVVNLVTGLGPTAGGALASHDNVDKIAFTGSTRTGKALVQAAAGNLKKLSLELGGKSPMIVLEDADLERVIPGAANAIFFNTGQVCIAGSRLYVHRKVFDKVVAGVADRAKNIRVGDGMAADTQMGPLVSQAQLDRVATYIESGRSEGAEVVAGGRRIGERGYFIAPTVLVNTRPEMKVVREEIFGPVLTASPFDDLDEVIGAANDTNYGLGASVWTESLSSAHRVARRLQAGNVWINSHLLTDPAMPFGGYKQSGWGRENGEEGLDAYLQTKSVFAPL